MTKIALIISGQLRNVKNLWQDQFRIFEHLKPDIFLHTWSNNKEYRDYINIDGSVDEFIRDFSPIAYKVENFEKHYISRYNNETERFRIMFYSIQESFRVFGNYIFNYDLAIRTRTDLKISNLENFNIEPYNNISDDSLYIPSHYNWGGANDQFGIMRPITYMSYSKTYENMDGLISNGIQPHPEKLLEASLKKEGINIHRIDFPYIIRRIQD